MFTLLALCLLAQEPRVDVPKADYDFLALERKVDTLIDRTTKVEARLGSVEDKLDRLSSKLDSTQLSQSLFKGSIKASAPDPPSKNLPVQASGQASSTATAPPVYTYAAPAPTYTYAQPTYTYSPATTYAAAPVTYAASAPVTYTYPTTTYATTAPTVSYVGATAGSAYTANGGGAYIVKRGLFGRTRLVPAMSGGGGGTTMVCGPNGCFELN